MSRSTAKFGGVYTLVYFLAALFRLLYLACLWLFAALGAYWLFDLCVFVAWLFVHFWMYIFLNLFLCILLPAVLANIRF